jgi:hypothetical protein
MGSLEDLRDLYKSSTKSKHLEIKSNGSTYSNAYRNEIYKRGNLVRKQVSGGIENRNEIDEKYCINSTQLDFSLNKKGRWKMAVDLKQNMSSFANDDIDVRLYETRDRIRPGYDNCISFQSSKGKSLKVRSTYANKDSIKRNLILEAQKARNPEIEIQKINKKRVASKTKSTNDWETERIIIDLNQQDEDDDNFVEYEVTHPPAMEVLKYNTLFDMKKKDRVSSRLCRNILGDELIKKDFEYDDEDYYESESEDKEELHEKNTQVSLLDLIKYTKPIVEKRRNDVSKAKINIDEESRYRKLIFISRQNSKIDNIQKAVIPEAVVEIKPDAIPLIAQINIGSLETGKLKEKFGLKYYEAFNAWPRMISINLNEDVIEEMMVDTFDVKAWLTIKQISVVDSTQNMYYLTVKANLTGDLIDLGSIETSETFEFEDIYRKIVKLIAGQPNESFLIKGKSRSGTMNETPVVNELPNIAAKSICKEMDVLKFELLNQTTNEADTINLVFKTQLCSCRLCFEENLPTDECTILTNCAHEICNSCWKHYIDASISNSFSNAGKLSCPVCDVELELAVILNFVSDINKFEQYLTASIDRILNVMCSYKWCQSPGCNKAIKVDLASTPYGILSCECGYKTCLKCNMEPHFPAKCSQLAKYYTELKAKNHFLIAKTNDTYASVGKKCPNCHIFMEKNGGCNQMTCTMCKEQFCWICVNTWQDHLKLTAGQHGCTIVSATKKTVTIEFKRDRQIKPSESVDYFNNSIYHRELRSRQNVRDRTANIKRLLGTIKQGELSNCLDFEKLSLHEKCKLEIEKRQEARQFLQKNLSFLNELHFVCEHTYLLLKDNTIDKNIKNIVLRVLNCLEMVIWKIHYVFDSSNGTKALNELEELMKKGLNCLNKINNLTIQV